MEGEQEWEGEESAPTLTLRTRKGKMVNLDAARVERTAETDRSVYLDRVEGTASTDENGGTKFSTVGFSAGEKNQGNGEADLETKINGLTNEDNNGSPVDKRAENQLGFNIRYLETANFTSAIESTDKNVAMKFQTNSMYTREENLETDESDFAKKKFENLDGLPNVGNHKSPMNMNAESQLDSKFIYSKVYGENGTTAFEPFENVIRASSHGRLVHGSKPVVETDVERVLEEQDTHDLYCPNCNSCITKRVILCKRKRTGQDVQCESKREKIEPVPQPDLNASTDTGPDIFRCLACFSFFIPTASGFKLIRIFGRSDKGENLNSPQQIPSKNLNWISSIHELLKSKKARNEPGNYVVQRVQEDNVQPLGPSKHSNGAVNSIIQSVEDDHPNLMGPSRHSEESLSHEMNDNDSSSQRAGLAEVISSNKEQVDNPELKPLEAEKSIPVSPKPGALLHGEIESDNEENLKGVPKTNIAGVSSRKGVQIDISELEAAAKKTDLEDDTAPPFVEGTATPAGPLSSQSNQTVPSSAAPGVLQDRETKIEIVQPNDGARTREWDILKSIVYGGLIESITSLGVVSSAAGSEAATLNIIALGLANLIGGLFVISHNLKELRNEHRSANDQNEQNLNRYQEILGRRENFWRHVVVAVFSYIIFGLIPPVIYGFSFRKTDNKEYKLIAVAAASLLCIALLAIGKAHVRKARKTYIKTLLYYVGTGMLASGLSYVVGQLIKKLLEKLGWFDSGAANPMSVFVETRSMRLGWASY